MSKNKGIQFILGPHLTHFAHGLGPHFTSLVRYNIENHKFDFKKSMCKLKIIQFIHNYEYEFNFNTKQTSLQGFYKLSHQNSF